MTRSAPALLFTGLAALVWSASAHAQSPASHYANNHVEANLHAGAFFLDEGEDTDAMVGGRLVYNLPSGWGFGGNFDWVLANTDLGDEDLDTNLYLYSAEIDYTFPSTSRIHFFVGAGIGGATISYEDAPEGLDDDTNVLIPVAGGLKWFNATHRPSWALRIDLRDNIILDQADIDEDEDEDEDEGDESEATNNFELSGGISFFFGGR